MRSGVIAQKVGMTRVFTDGGEHVPVTVLRLANCQVVAHRTKDKNGYVAVQLGSGVRKSNNVNKPDRGYFAAAKVEPKRKLAEFRRTYQMRVDSHALQHIHVGLKLRDALRCDESGHTALEKAAVTAADKVSPVVKVR